MNDYKFCSFGHTEALDHAIRALQAHGWQYLPSSTAALLLLPVPSFDSSGHIHGSSGEFALPNNGIVIGGNLTVPELIGCKAIDLLQDPVYLAENAAITAHCALNLAMSELPVTMHGCSVLVIGWGRIGKCLAALLKTLGANVTVAARSPADRAMLLALDYCAIPIENLNAAPYRLIYNTVPAMVLPNCPDGALKIDLASKPGLAGSNVIYARGLPNRYAPESSGKLIADSVIRIITGKEHIQ